MPRSRLAIHVLIGTGIAAVAVVLTLVVVRFAAPASTASADTLSRENQELRAELNQLQAAERARQAAVNAARAEAKKAQSQAAVTKDELKDVTKKYEDLLAMLDEFGVPLVPERYRGPSRPPTNLKGVIKASRNINGTHYATISLGSEQNVQKGMKFKVIADGNFLAYLTVDSVDSEEAVGHLEGPGVAAVRKGTQVRTQW
jgi:hypothetical protein